MDTILNVWHTMGYETPRQTECTGKAQALRHRTSQARPFLSCCRRPDARFFKFCRALESSLSKDREGWAAAETDAGTPMPVKKASETKASPCFGTRSFGSGLSNGSMDIEANRRSDTQAFWYFYSTSNLWYLMNGLGWSCQKPTKRAKERREQAIRYWKRSVWPHIKKGRRAWSPFGFHG